MSRVTAPLLSFTASGKLADTLVASTWKGIPYMRKYVVPSNPQTTAQTTQRGYVTSIVSAWKNYFTTAGGRSAWNRWATANSRTMSGFNAFASNALQVIPDDADASFCDYGVALAGNRVKFGMKNLDDGAAGDEAGAFEIWTGSTISGMTLLGSDVIGAGVIDSPDAGDTDDVIYCKLRKGGFDRSGVFQITLIA